MKYVSPPAVRGLHRHGLAKTDLALPCWHCGTETVPTINSYDRWFYGCPACGTQWSKLLWVIMLNRNWR